MYPDEPVGIVHLAGGTYKQSLKVAIPKFGAAEILLTRSSVSHWFSNRRMSADHLAGSDYTEPPAKRIEAEMKIDPTGP
jgi:hypothetical protein